jgi:tetratricopeptide (TPR) repeat protein
MHGNRHLLPTLTLCAAFIGSATAEVRHRPSEERHVSDEIRVSATLCALHQLKREYRLAIQACNEALRVKPEDAEAYSNRGAAYLMLDELDRAILDFDAAIRLDPADPTQYYNRATAYTKKREHLKAVADYTEAIRLSPGLAIAYNNRGYEFEQLGERDKAIADYRKALELAPSFKSIRQNLKRLGAE